MRVLHVDSGREMRGGQWQVLRLVAELGEGNILLCPRNSPLMTHARKQGLDARPSGPAAVYRLSRQCDITHAHDSRSHSLGAAFAGSPLVVSRRVAFPPGASWLSRWKYSRAAHYAAVSEGVAGELRNAGVEAERISVVYDGVPLPAAAVRGSLIVTPASDDPMKGADLVREAARGHCLEICFSKNLERDLERAALLVYITRSEGLGSAALLAMAAGVPVVASRVGGLPEIVHDGRTGILTDNQPAAIAAAIAAALAKREELGENARRWVEENATVAKMAAGMRRVYEGVLQC